MRCPKCGQDNYDNAPFCATCGMPLKVAEPAGGKPCVAGDRDEAVPSKVMPEQKSVKTFQVARETKERAPISRNTIIIVVIAVLVLLVIILAISLFGRKAGNNAGNGRSDWVADSGYAVGGMEEADQDAVPVHDGDDGVYSAEEDVDADDALAAVADIMLLASEKMANMANGGYDCLYGNPDDNYITAYYEDGTLHAIKCDGWMYLFDGGELMYASLDENSSSHEFFFRDGDIQCWIETDASGDIVHDINAESRDYLDWQYQILEGADFFFQAVDTALNTRFSMSDITKVTASSALYQSDMGFTHSPERLIDGSLDKAWAEGEAGNGVGSWFRMDFEDYRVLSGFDIYAGYQKSDRVYYGNPRPAEVDVYIDGSYAGSYALDDYYGEQHIALDSAWLASRLYIEITDIYSGNESSWPDMVISEISFY